MSEGKPATWKSDQYRGWAYKWTNYIKGYQKRWFVLRDGLLSYYRNQAEMAHTCRGTISLATAFIHTEDSISFVVSTNTRTLWLRASSEVERQKWVTALELAKSSRSSIQATEAISDDDEEDEVMSANDQEVYEASVQLLTSKVEDIRTCNDLIDKQMGALQTAFYEMEQAKQIAPETHEGGGKMSLAIKMKEVMERATIFRVTASAMTNTCREYTALTQTQGRRWQKLLAYERELRQKTQEMVEAVAQQNNIFEMQARKKLSRRLGKGTVRESQAGHSDDDEFFDADDRGQEDSFSVSLASRNIGPSSAEDGSSCDEADDFEAIDMVSVKVKGNPPSTDNAVTSSAMTAAEMASKRVRRAKIPEKPNYSISLWAIMKNCIGRDLSRIPMPVNFNEPLSMLQRMSEEMEYASILHSAAELEDSCEQLAYIAAFTVSAYATTHLRVGKPFNPLLGETFEYDRREDLGWRYICEQVSHHPPTIACYTEGRGWTHSQEFTMSSKFRGKYLQLIPLGIAHLHFHKSGNHYTWRKVVTTVHNIIVGRLWVDNHGEMQVTNHRNGDSCHLKFSEYSFFSREPARRVTGVVTTKENIAKWVISGSWDLHIDAAKVTKALDIKGKPVFETADPMQLWTVNPIPPENEKMYRFGQFAIALNEMEPLAAPTDSRFRPDQRSMEEADWANANKLKERLEEKQRATRRLREVAAEAARKEGRDFLPYQPTWFVKKADPITGNPLFQYHGGYWEAREKQDWSVCPNIFLQ